MIRRESNKYFILDGIFSGAFNYDSALQTNQANKKNVEATNKTNLEIAEKTNANNLAIAQKNLSFQRENLDYTKALQQQLFQREDSSYQRTVNDMRQAGLSPLSMNGTNGSGEAIATNPLSMDMQYQNPSAMQSFQASAPQLALGNLGSLIDIAKSYEELKGAQLDNANKDLQNEGYHISLSAQNADYNYDRKIKRAMAESSYYDSLSKSDKQRYNQFYGINDNMGEKERLAHVIAKQFGYSLNDDNGNPRMLGKEALSALLKETPMGKTSKNLASALESISKPIEKQVKTTTKQIEKSTEEDESRKLQEKYRSLHGKKNWKGQTYNARTHKWEN